jgi:hypothetical protein
MSSCGIAWHKSIEVKSSLIVIGAMGVFGSDDADPAHAGEEMTIPIIMSNKNVFWFTGSFSLFSWIIDFNFN